MHVEKFTRAQVGQLQTHYARPDGRNYGNEKIDATKSHENYNLAPDRGSVSEYLESRLNEVRHINRKDINVMCTWVVTLPKDYGGDERQFFQASYDILAEKYGEKNVLSAYVHKDEVTPHMHFSFMPVVAERDRDGQMRERLCAKDLIKKSELLKMHPFMERELQERLHEPVHIRTGETATKGNRTIEQLKKETLDREIQEQQRSLGDARSAYDTVSKDLNDKRQELEQVKNALRRPISLPEPRKAPVIGKYYPKDEMDAYLRHLDAQRVNERQELIQTRERAQDADRAERRMNEAIQQMREWANRSETFERMLQSKDPRREYRDYEVEHDGHSRNHEHTHSRGRDFVMER